jgi:hypothetical protein
MNTFLRNDLIERFGYGMAIYISAKASAMQRTIDSINAERQAAGGRLLESASIDEVVAVLQRKGKLPVLS